MDDVRAFVTQNGYEFYESQMAGIAADQQLHGGSIGEKSIWAYPGDYWPLPFHILIIGPMYFFRVSVEYDWAFDKQGKLIEIRVKKTTDAP